MKFVITGASRGLGLELSKILVQHGTVIGLSRSQGPKSLLSSGVFHHVNCDLSSLAKSDNEYALPVALVT